MTLMDFFTIKVNVNFIFNEIDLRVIGTYMYLGFRGESVWYQFNWVLINFYLFS